MMELVDGERGVGEVLVCWCVDEVKLFPLYSDGGECRHFSPIDALTSIHPQILHSNSDGVLAFL